MYARHDVEMSACNHTQCHASTIRQVQVGRNQVHHIALQQLCLQRKRCFHLPAPCQHAITCKPDQSSHVGVSPMHQILQQLQQHWTEQIRKLDCTSSASRESLLSSITLPCRLSGLQGHWTSLQFGDARCSPVRSGAAGRLGLDFAANGIGF